MAQLQYRRVEATERVSPMRAHVHDLRNLFAVVASAKYLLERPLGEQKRAAILEALGKVAAEGTVLTNGLLSEAPSRQPPETDAPQALRKLEPMLVALAGPERRIELEFDDSPARIGMTRSALEAIVLELATNALSAGARSVTVRGVSRGGSFWVLVGDDGRGFAAFPSFKRRPAGLHGTGMSRIADAAAAAHGSLHVRSKLARGSVVALSLPLLPVVEREALEAQAPARTRPVVIPLQAMA